MTAPRLLLPDVSRLIWGHQGFSGHEQEGTKRTRQESSLGTMGEQIQMNVAIYARVSTADQSTVLQLDELRDYCQRRGDFCRVR